MTTMTAMPHEYDWTVDDLDKLPDDGFQYELLDGLLLVSPAPTLPHRSKYEDAGVLSYWAIDPQAPSIVAWDLVDGRYVDAGTATGEETLALQRPFPVEVTPSALVR